MKNFAIGFISKEKVLNLITVERFIKPNFTYSKLLIIIFTLISTYLLSFIRIKRSFTTNDDSVYSNNSSSKDIRNNDFSIENIPSIDQTDLSLISYLKKIFFT